jgi:Fur family ferric uptake transcriptional regulator
MSPLAVERVAEELRAPGLRVTPPRLAVYRAVSELNGHQTVDVIASRASRARQRLDAGRVRRPAPVEPRPVECAVGSASCLDPSDTGGFAIDEAEITFWGLCPDCQSNPYRLGRRGQ